MMRPLQHMSATSCSFRVTHDTSRRVRSRPGALVVSDGEGGPWLPTSSSSVSKPVLSRISCGGRGEREGGRREGRKLDS